ncbi:MAG: hypothetical protein U0L10_11195, partial [Lachnospiraceae bacterium]|nr:hypothetical protein [Lachnospiraceae bacterium]
MIRDSLDKYLDKQKRPCLGLFCHFSAEKLIILQILGNIMVKSGPGSFWGVGGRQGRLSENSPSQVNQRNTIIYE